MIKIDREKVKNNKFPITLIFIELILVLLVVYLLYKMIGLQLDFQNRVLSFVPNTDPMIPFFFVLSLALLIAVYFAIKKKAPDLFQAQQLAKGTIKKKTVEKLKVPKTDTRAAALLLVEILFVFAVVITITAWLDPDVELIPWSRVGVLPPLTTIFNTIIAIIGLGFFYYLYSLTAWYRKK